MARQARAPEAKQRRKEEIAQAAFGLFAEKSYAEITVAQVADRAELAKGTVYLYFKTKEEVFLYAVEQEEESWLNDLSRRFARIGRRKASATTVARAIGKEVAEAIRARHQFLQLLTRLRSAVEERADVDAIIEMKRRTLARVRLPVKQLAELVPGLDEEQSLQLLLWIHMLVVGCASILECRQDVKEVIEESPDLQPFRFYNEAGLADAVAAVILGTIEARR